MDNLMLNKIFNFKTINENALNVRNNHSPNIIRHFTK